MSESGKSLASLVSVNAELKEIEYTTKLHRTLNVCSVSDFLAGKLNSKGAFILRTNRDEYAVSQWTSPKRTRSYPFARVYDTLSKKNRVTIVPFCKDEGADGDRDFLQWDTVSLMSLFNVYVIIGYYCWAEKSERPEQAHKNKITNQVLNYRYIGSQLEELQNYHSSALHWNLKQMENISLVAELTLNSYRAIRANTGVALHGESGIEERIEIAKRNSCKFKEMSRQLSKKAQNREVLTKQPKEKTIGEKASLTLTNLIGGVYYWTVDECFVIGDRVFLVEKKHSDKKIFPSTNDIKDAFIKLALFSNISSLKYRDKYMPYYAAVGLTSKMVQGDLSSNMRPEEISQFLSTNKFHKKDEKVVLAAINEARCNGFGLFVSDSKGIEDRQQDILMRLTTC